MQRSSDNRLEGNVSKVFKSLTVGRWKHIEAEPYKKESGSYKGMTRFELVGKRGESPHFHTRYFEIDPEGYSSFEQHEHEHVVMVLRGSGQVRIGCDIIELAGGDLVYIRPNDPHQFLNTGSDEPFGFICMVNAERDRPVSVDGAESCEICQ